ncbi:MAG: LPXTG cell wall anchor domain-containing protein, partial [Acidimicrobiia bacterium]
KGGDVTSNDTATVPVIEVKSEVAVPPTTTTTTTSAAPSTSVKGTVALPVTGAEIAEFGVVGLGILGSGYGMVLGARRRRRKSAGNSSE